MNYCPHCGLSLSCPHCGASDQAGLFCGECGVEIVLDVMAQAEQPEPSPKPKGMTQVSVRINAAQLSKIDRLTEKPRGRASLLRAACERMRECGVVPDPTPADGAIGQVMLKLPTALHAWLAQSTSNMAGSIRAAIDQLEEG